MTDRNERLETENSKLGGVSKDLFDDVCCERDTALAKLAEVEAELEKLRSRHLWNSTYADTEEGLKNLDCSPEVLNSIKTRRQLERELTREREAVKSLSDQLEWSLKNEAQYKNAMKKAFEVETVMREALEQIQSLAANEHEQGDSKALDDVLDLTCETFKALAKADEILQGLEK